MASDDIMKEGDNIVLDVNGEKLSFVKLAASGKVRVGKNSCSMKAFIGMPFGTAFFMQEDNVLRPTDEITTDGIETATNTERVCNRSDSAAHQVSIRKRRGPAIRVRMYQKLHLIIYCVFIRHPNVL